MSDAGPFNCDPLGRSELHYAAAKGDIVLVSRLIEEGADVRLADKNQWTPLHFAAQAQSVPVILALLSKGAEVDAADSLGNTPLSMATFGSRGNGDAIAALRSAGANPLAKNKYGVSPVALARKIANYNIAQFFQDIVVQAGQDT